VYHYTKHLRVESYKKSGGGRNSIHTYYFGNAIWIMYICIMYLAYR